MSEQKLVLLEGRVPRELRYSLSHDEYCEKVGECHCSTTRVGVMKTSKVTKKAAPVFKQKRIPSILTVRYRKRTQTTEAVLLVPAIARAVARRYIRVHR